ncbi:Xaa-Pro peptidase family protein [Dethiosulfovibrio sp. F2B]|uniref:M24 family metallopeptidase n=1 Tax=Dethiosulfovibrio faecalis TaxID=2720018 RepID=UPI001F23E775|nr:Xaa-Pro peptidase family protein [Dethiosulfovibrio faecalis]MCF4150821.1 Xaa-Pro peptidase family protein [Dethiosulfovibrio faecalis]
MSKFDHLWNRVGRLRKEMAVRGLDGVLLTDVERYGWENVFYLSGFRGSSAAVLITDDDAVLSTDSRYVSQAAEQTPFRVLVQSKQQTIFDMIEEMLRRHSVRRCGFEGETLSYGTYRRLSSFSVIWEDTDGMIPAIRRTKDDLEISTIVKACRIASDAYERALKDVSVGMTELEFSKCLEGHIVSLGGEGGWPDHRFIVASGARSALPHGTASDKKLAKGEWVTVDFGAAYGGYMSDLTRNFSLGEVSDPEFLEIHSLLEEAHRAGAEAIAPGKTGREVDFVARSIIDRAGYGDFFGHGLGHGLGVEIHESPRLSPRSAEILSPGDVVTVEPGVYIPERGGLRLEDDYLVTEDGHRRLSCDLPQDFRILPL